MTNPFDDFAQTPANYVPLTPLSFLKRTAAIFPHHKAVIYRQRNYNWGQVYRRSRRLASALSKHGINRGDTVAVLAANTPEIIEAHFGVPMAGAVLNTINTRLDANTIAYILRHGAAKVLIVDAEISPQIEHVLALYKDKNLLIIDILDWQNSDNPRSVGVTDYEAFLASGDANYNWELPTNEWDAISLNYTSGTSGCPKGVVYHHRGAYLLPLGTIADWQLPRHPTYLCIVPFFHCNGWGHAWAMAAVAGTMICLRTVIAHDIYTAIAQYKVTHFGGAPIVLNMLLNAPISEQKNFNHHIEVMTAAAPPPASILAGVERLGFNVTHVYGLTETYGHTLMCFWQSDWDKLDLGQRSDLKARQGVRMVYSEGVRVVDTKTGKDVAADGRTTGEIILRGNMVMKGYLNNPKATAAAFANGWFHSGDLAVMHADGYVEIKDRLKDIIISGGENISSVEIESVLHRHHAILLAAVIAKPDAKWGEVPCAFVELKTDKTVNAQELITFCRQHLAGFKCPKQIIFAVLPKTSTGKIQKFQLRKLL